MNPTRASVLEFGVCASCAEARERVTALAPKLDSSWSRTYPIASPRDVLRSGLDARELARANGLGSRRCQEVFIVVACLAAFVLRRGSAARLELVLDRQQGAIRATASYRPRPSEDKPNRQSGVIPVRLGAGTGPIRRFADALLRERDARGVRLTAFLLHPGRECRCPCPAWAVAS